MAYTTLGYLNRTCVSSLEVTTRKHALYHFQCMSVESSFRLLLKVICPWPKLELCIAIGQGKREKAVIYSAAVQ